MDIKQTLGRRSGTPWWLLLALVLGIGVLFGCSEPVEDPIVATEVAAVEGQEVIVTRIVLRTLQVEITPVIVENQDPVILDVSINEEITTLDPQLSAGEPDIHIIDNIFAGLTRYNHRSNTIDPELATDWRVSEDGLTWTFNLRDDIYWVRRDQPGRLLGDEHGVDALRPVTSHDVVFAIQRACDSRLATPDVFVLFVIEGCEQVYDLKEATPDDLDGIKALAINDTTLEIILTEPASHFLTMTSTWLLRPVPVEIVEEMADEWDLVENIVTSGPFVLSTESLMDTRIVLERNPYWPLPFEGNADVVNILQIDSWDAYQLWQNRNLDVSPVPRSEQDNILSQYEGKSILVPNQAVFYLAYNMDSPVFKFPEVRRAFSWAIDRERLIREVHGGRGNPMRHIAPPGVIAAPPIDEIGVGYSPDKARQQMNASPFGDCRLITPIRYMVTNSDIALQQAELFREMWLEELNCPEDKIIIEQVQFGTLLASTGTDVPAAERPDLWDLGWSSYYPDEDNWVGDVLHCSESENRQNRACSQVDNWIVAADELVELEERINLYRQIERSFFGDQGSEPVSPLYVRVDYYLRHGWVDYVPASFGGERFDTYYVDSEVRELEQNR
ncbi:MAG TPA: peptide ABC transporter substrate-binding protein [candidate division Zixibacteria bacterium]|nr:peptide ABC transporter substrate-binding protein [candidate division Zixibacteria bacterium]